MNAGLAGCPIMHEVQKVPSDSAALPAAPSWDAGPGDSGGVGTAAALSIRNDSRTRGSWREARRTAAHQAQARGRSLRWTKEPVWQAGHATL